MMASSPANHTEPLVCSENRPKRVILRLRVNEFDGESHSWEEYIDAIHTYLTWAGRPASEYDGSLPQARKHFAHIEPFQDPELQQTTFHVILDMEHAMLNDPDFNTVPHEIYRIRRDKEAKLYKTSYSQLLTKEADFQQRSPQISKSPRSRKRDSQNTAIHRYPISLGETKALTSVLDGASLGRLVGFGTETATKWRKIDPKKERLNIWMDPRDTKIPKPFFRSVSKFLLFVSLIQSYWEP
jgi:hypothetical protein